jgi:hypothetical protein
VRCREAIDALGFVAQAGSDLAARGSHRGIVVDDQHMQLAGPFDR